MTTAAAAVAFGEEVLTGVEALRTSGIDVTWRSDRAAPSEPAVEHVAVMLGDVARGTAIVTGSASAARAESVRHAVARYAWLGRFRVPARLQIGTVASLGADAIPLDEIAGYSPALRARAATALGFTRSTEFVWMEGESLTRCAERWLPAQLAVRGATGHGPAAEREPELRPRVATGVAAHPDRRAAILDAMLQIIERDAFMITWLCRLPVRALALDEMRSPALADLVARIAAGGLSATIVSVPTDVPIPVALAVLRDTRPEHPAIAVGIAARPTTAAAATEALGRALGTRRLVGERLSEHRAVPRDSGRLDGVSRLLWWADARRADELAWLSRGAARDVPDEETDGPADDVLERLVEWFAAAGEDVVVVDLVDEALARRLGHHVVAVVAPGFHPIHLDEARPARWSVRLRTMPAALDLRAAAMLNVLPHPIGAGGPDTAPRPPMLGPPRQSQGGPR